MSAPHKVGDSVRILMQRTAPVFGVGTSTERPEWTDVAITAVTRISSGWRYRATSPRTVEWTVSA